MYMDFKQLPVFQRILVEILYCKSQNKKFFFKNQIIIKTEHNFYQIVNFMLSKGLINKENHSRITNYSLTDRGYLLAVLLSRIIDTPTWLKNIEHKIISWDFE